MKTKNTNEKELYTPLKKFFENSGYLVRGEVKNCDIACTLGEKLTIIEMKMQFNLKLVYQAMERKKLADDVFVAIPRPKNFRKKEVKNMIQLLKALEIGLITVALDSKLKTVDLIYSPDSKKTKASKKRTTILNEIKKREKDFNLGGSNSKDTIITAYRESSIQIACFLKHLKTASPKQLVDLGCKKTVGKILYTNHYNWFFKISRGVYSLSEEGEKMLLSGKFKDVIQFYETGYKKCLK